jgi:hypothetical protein
MHYLIRRKLNLGQGSHVTYTGNLAKTWSVNMKEYKVYDNLAEAEHDAQRLLHSGEPGPIVIVPC